MGLSDGGRTAMHTGFAAQALFASLHNGDPGSAGVNELTGGSPAYARRPVVWGTPGPVLDTAADITFNVPGGGTTPKFFGFWTASTGGTFLGSGALAAQETYVNQGQYVLTLADSLLT